MSATGIGQADSEIFVEITKKSGQGIPGRLVRIKYQGLFNSYSQKSPCSEKFPGFICSVPLCFL